MKCGFYEREVTPPLGCHMRGYSSVRDADGVLTELYVKAVAIESDGNCCIIISLDGCGTTRNMHQIAVERITAATGVPSDRILLQSNHTHSAGPIADPPYDNFLNFTPDAAYMDVLSRICGDCGVLAYQRMVGASAKAAKKDVYGVSFIRNFKMKSGDIRMNPGRLNPEIEEVFGTLDPELSMVFFEGKNKEPLGAMVNFGMHHDCVGGNKYCGDYSGYMAELLKKTYGEKFVTVFINGACGNVNHIDVSMSREDALKQKFYIRNGEILAKEVTELEKIAEPIEIDRVDGKKETMMIERRQLTLEEVAEYNYLMENMSESEAIGNATNPEDKRYKRFKAPRVLAFHKLPDMLPYVIQTIVLGDIVIYGLSGEVYAEIGLSIKKASPKSFNMISEMSNGGYDGYLPIKEAFCPTLYETQIPTASLIPEAAELVISRTTKLAEEMCK